MIYLKIKNLDDENRITKILNELSIEFTKKLSKKEKICIIDCNKDEIENLLLNKKKVIVLANNKLNDKNNEILYDSKVYTFRKDNDLREILVYLKSKAKKIKRIKKFGIITLLLIIIMTAIFTLSRNYIPVNVEAKKEDNSKEQENIDYKKENIIFLGDSITNFYNLDTFYSNLPVVNSGTSGFQTTDIIKHLKDYVYIYNPTKVFLLIGTNDIAFTDITNEKLIENIGIIIDEIRKNRPNCEIYIESIYPVNRNTDNDIVSSDMVGRRENNRIIEINKMIKQLCKEKNAEYINMYDKLTDENGNLKLEYTIDGLHISPEGYKVITKSIMKYIETPAKL